MRPVRRQPLVRAGAVAAAAALACAGLATPAHAKTDLGHLSNYVEQMRQNAGSRAVANKWFVQVQGAPTQAGGSVSTAKATQKSVVQAATARGLKVSVTRSFTTAFNGMTIHADDASMANIAALPGVVRVFPVLTVSRPATTSSNVRPTMANALGMTGADIAQNKLGLTGKGIKIGVIDTGIDYDNADFGGKGTPRSTQFPNAKVAYGYDFVGDDYDAEKGGTPVPDAFPDDCQGHGSHVAGIAAGNGDPAKGGVRGVAPAAVLGAYRVFGCEGSADTDVILAAMEKASADGMDVVNMSLGDGFMTWPDYPTAQAGDLMVKRGTVLLAAAGNDGADGMFSGGAPGFGQNTIGVASFDNAAISQLAFTTSIGRNVGYAEATGAPRPPATGTMPLRAVAAPGTASQGCAPLAAVPAGTALLVQRGTCTFREKALAAQNAGAAAVILYNNAPGVVNPTVAGDPAITIPVVMISQADGTALANAALAGSVTMTWGPYTSTTIDPKGGLISDFSSWGLAANLQLKPDFGAPGGNIWSSLPLEQGGHGSKSGTSMATPYAAGTVALLLQARPDLKGQAIKVRDLLQNTAVPAGFSFQPDAGPDMVIRQGAGMINIVRALSAKATITPGKISLGDQRATPLTTTLTITNTARTPVSYTVSNLDGVGAVGPSDPELDLLPAVVKAPTTITVGPRASVKVPVTISQPVDAPTGYVYGGWIVLKGNDGSVLRVPYAGMAGDYQSLQAIQDTGKGFPWLARLQGDSYVQQTAGANFTMQGTDVPFAVFHLEYPVSDLQLWVYQANADGSKGAQLGTQPVVPAGAAGRDTSSTALAWDGSYVVETNGKKQAMRAPAGKYLLEVRALKALGNRANAAQWEAVDTPWFSIGNGTVSQNLVQVQSNPQGKLLASER